MLVIFSSCLLHEFSFFFNLTPLNLSCPHFLCSKETGSKAQVIREYNLIKTTLLLAESMQWCNYSDFKYSDDFNVTLIESLWFKFPWPAWVGRLIYWCRPAKEKHEIIVAKNTLVSYNGNCDLWLKKIELHLFIVWASYSTHSNFSQ